MTEFRACAVIPTFNHHAALPGLLSHLVGRNMPAIVVDDGSAAAAAERIAAACQAYSGIEYLRRKFNGGKGCAVISGLARANERGFTHAVQIDADGQHDPHGLTTLMEAAANHPDAIVSGQPRYDGTVPPGRRLGRWLTHVWVCINTLSFRIKDSMCGFRVYPIVATLTVARQEVVGRRMDFDVEVLVRSYWRGTPIIEVPVGVTYPADNFSNFDLLRDNVLISGMHARLFFGMLVRMPRLLMRNLHGAGVPGATPIHWADLGERGAYWGLSFVAVVYRRLGRRICLVVVSVVVVYFFLTGRKQRQASLAYLERASKAGVLRRKPGPLTSLRHFMTFGSAVLDKFASWTGSISLEDVDGISSGLFAEVMAEQRGAFVITAHLGNPEALRALATLSESRHVNALVHTVHAERFNRLIAAFSPQSQMRMIQVTRVGAETAITLSEAVERGEWVVMAGDRVAVGEPGERATWIPFMGDLAPFPQGPYILASLLKCPTYLMFCLRHGDRYEVHFRKLADRVTLPRHRRSEAIRSYAQDFVGALEEHVGMAPFQWFNFFDFWRPAGIGPPPTKHADELTGGVCQ